MEFLKEFLEKILNKNQQMTKNHEKLPNMHRINEETRCGSPGVVFFPSLQSPPLSLQLDFCSIVGSL